MRSPTPMDPAQDPQLNAAGLPEPYPDTRRLLFSFLEKGWILALGLVICLAVGVIYIRRAPVTYSSTATIEVVQDKPQVFGPDPTQARDLQALDFLQTVAQSIKARPLLERVADTNSLAGDPLFSTTATNRDQVVQTLEELITVKLRRGTRLIDIRVSHSSPVLAGRIANSLVSEYVHQNAEQRVTSAEVANEALLREGERLRKKLEQSENALQAYKEEHKASSLDDRKNTVVAELRELTTKVTEAKSTRIKAESDYNQLLSLGTNTQAVLTLPALAADPAVVAAQLTLTRAENDFAALELRYREKHPKYLQGQAQVAALRIDLEETVGKAGRTIEANLERARASENALLRELRTQEAAGLELDKLAIQHGVLVREVELDRALYESVVKSMNETTITKEMNPMSVRVVQPANTPDRPVSPRKAMILVMSCLAGLMVGFLVVLALGYFDSSLKTVDEAESVLRLPVLSTVSQTREIKRGRHPIMLLEDARSSAAESFRTLRTSLSMLGRVEDRRVFLFTSALPQEGKTFCSLNYAASLAQMNLKTLLIDGDLRRPTIEPSVTGKVADSPGVTDYLTGHKTFAEVVQPTKLPGLFYIAGGSTAPNPAELLAQDGLAALIQEALREYDRVVMDSAPIHAVSDTLLMVRGVQTVCLVIRAARTSSRSVLRCTQLLSAAGAPLSGVVLNRMPVRRALGYFYYRYSPYYDYKYSGKYSKKGVYGTGATRRTRETQESSHL